MDNNLLVNEILTRVSAKLSELEARSYVTNKRKILILTEQHGKICHELLENPRLQSCCQIECALLKEYNCDLNEYDTVVIYNISNNALAKIAGGIGDTPFTCMASKAILMGKKIYIPNQEIELYQYAQTAPTAYYAMLNDKLKLLRDSGVIFCQAEDLEQIFAGSEQPRTGQKISGIANGEGKRIAIDKKVITELDIKKFYSNDVSCLCIPSKAILTDLAKEYLSSKRIEIEREPCMNGKQRDRI